MRYGAIVSHAFILVTLLCVTFTTGRACPFFGRPSPLCVSLFFSGAGLRARQLQGVTRLRLFTLIRPLSEKPRPPATPCHIVVVIPVVATVRLIFRVLTFSLTNYLFSHFNNTTDCVSLYARESLWPACSLSGPALTTSLHPTSFDLPSLLTSLQP